MRQYSLILCCHYVLLRLLRGILKEYQQERVRLHGHGGGPGGPGQSLLLSEAVFWERGVVVVLEGLDLYHCLGRKVLDLVREVTFRTIGGRKDERKEVQSSSYYAISYVFFFLVNKM